MSRTKKDRPHWVRVNDPKSSRYANHDHMVRCREKVGEEPVYREKLSKDNWHWEKELVYMRPVYHFWVEEVPCTIDRAEPIPSAWRTRSMSRTDEEFNAHQRNGKHCHYWLNFDGDYVSGKDFKKLTHGAERSKIRTQLHNAVRDNGRWVDYFLLDDEENWFDAWDEVDVHNDSKYASRGWWDW